MRNTDAEIEEAARRFEALTDHRPVTIHHAMIGTGT